ncbi:MAG: aspartate aminotransferase family protein [Deltaproteobacteria bacterium]|nr:aspartate aminotransferase family protein [Deltaproteobacteria bacterium]
MAQITLPPKGSPRRDVLAALRSLKKDDADWHEGRMFGLIYDAGREVEEVAIEAASIFMIENALSPMAFPSLLKMETEVVSMVISLSGGDDDAVGSVTSGGTESILMTVKAARDWARDVKPEVKPEIKNPEMIAPVTAHPAWNKAAHYLGLKMVNTPVTDDLKADVKAMEDAITENTILLGGTAVTYPHGMVDPIEEIGKTAQNRNLWMHVDACLGGLILPFIEKLGYEIPPYDFRVPGVKSISADIGGIYATPCIAGGRPGGPLASAWAVMHFLGEEGFLKLAQTAKEAADKLMKGINETPMVHVLGQPDATVFAIGSEELNIFELGARMNELGWHMDFQHLPPSLHMTISPIHASIVDLFLEDLKKTASTVSKIDPEDMSGEAAMYAMIGTMPDREKAREFALQYLNDLYRWYFTPVKKTRF